MPKRFMQFFMPDAPAGSSGAAAVDTTIAPTGEIDPLTYEPPNEVDVQKWAEKEDDSAPPEGTTTAKPPVDDPTKVKPPEQKPPEAKPPEAKKPEPPKPEPAAQLRDRLKQLEEKSADLEKQLEAAKTDKRVDELNAKIADNDKKMAEVERQKIAAEKKLEAYNPHVNKRLAEMRSKFNDNFNDVLESVPSLKGDYQKLLDQYQELPHGKENYAEKLAEFKASLRERFEDDAPTAFDMIRKGVAFRRDYAKAADEVASESGKILFEEDRAKWESGHKNVETGYDKWFEPPADAESVDPFNTKLFLKKFEAEVIEPAERERVNSSIKGYVDRVFNGAQPRTAADFPGMPEEAARAEMNKINAQIESERASAPEVMAVCMKMAAYGRALIAQNATLRERLAAKNGSAPPDPTKEGVTKKKEGEGGAGDHDVLTMELPSAESIAAAIGED